MHSGLWRDFSSAQMLARHTGIATGQQEISGVVAASVRVNFRMPN
jgi:hypothetical protein